MNCSRGETCFRDLPGTSSPDAHLIGLSMKKRTTSRGPGEKELMFLIVLCLSFVFHILTVMKTLHKELNNTDTPCGGEVF